MQNYCGNCGAKLPAGASFCPSCGEIVPLVIEAPYGSTVVISDTPPENILQRSEEKPAGTMKPSRKI